MTKIDIFSGFLGAGKTTLIKKLLEEAFKGEKLVLIENEFGEIGIDGGFLKDAGVEITEMNSGCICCSLVGDFGTALQEVLDKFKPDRIIIEPSGVGKLSDVIKAVEGVASSADIKINSIVTVADGTKCKMYMKNFGEFYNNQISNAKTIVLSRTQNMKEDRLEACVAMIREQNENATVITTAWDQIDGKTILSAMEKSESLAQEMLKEEEICPSCGHHHDHDHDHDHECGCGHDHDHHHHHADDVFTSWGVETPHKYEEANMKEILEKLANNEEFGIILRAKGMVEGTNGQWIYFDLVPGEYELRAGSPDYTGKLCVIGTKLKEEKLKELIQLA